MAFVITGNAWAEEYNDFKFPTGMNSIYSDGYHYYPDPSEIKKPLLSNKVIIDTERDFQQDHVMIYGSFQTGRTNPPGNSITEKNVLEIKKNLTVNEVLELFGCAVNHNKDGMQANLNEVKIIGEAESIDLRVYNPNVEDGLILVVGGMNNVNYSGSTACNNMVYINNVRFLAGKENDSIARVSIEGGEGRSGHAINNYVEVKNTAIAFGKICGGNAENRSGKSEANGEFPVYNANGNIVTLGDGAKIDENVLCAGGYAFNKTAGSANSNVVNIEGNSKILSSVYGGYTLSGATDYNTINIKDTANVSNASLYGCNNTTGQGNTLNIGWDSKEEKASTWSGKIGSAENFNKINIYEGSDVTFGKALEAPEVVLNDATWNVTQEGNKVGTLKNNNGKIAFGNDGHLDVNGVGSGEVIITEDGKTADNLNTASQLTTVAEKMGVAEGAKESAKAKVVMEAGEVVGKTTGIVAFETKGSREDTYYHGVVTKVTEEINPANEAISDTGVSMKLHWRAHVDDMNKRMGELRDANCEYGVWTRMVRGESEYKNTKAQYNQYQLGYDEKLSVDKRWTVGAAVTFSDGKASYGYGSTEDKSTAFAIYGTKLNNDGTFVDLIARYAHLESDVEDQAGKGSYSANGMSVSAEVGKRIQQDNGLWIEPQVQLTYGTVDSAEYKIGTKTVEVGDMNSLIGRVGFRIGKDIEKGNVYARASYLYDFEGETQNAFRNDTARRTFAEDLGGGWWEVGIGTNINLSKATYLYAEVDKTFGGEVDTNWQWNLGVRYSF